jgi:hypothetical protein
MTRRLLLRAQACPPPATCAMPLPTHITHPQSDSLRCFPSPTRSRPPTSDARPHPPTTSIPAIHHMLHACNPFPNPFSSPSCRCPCPPANGMPPHHPLPVLSHKICLFKLYIRASPAMLQTWTRYDVLTLSP